MKNRTVFFVLLTMAALLGMTIALWPTMWLELDGTAKIVEGSIEITDAEIIAQITAELEAVRFSKTFADGGHVLDNHDTYWLKFYDADGELIAETGHLFVDNDQTCLIGEGWTLWRSGIGQAVKVELYEQLFTE